MKKLILLIIVFVALQYRGAIMAWFNPVDPRSLHPDYDIVLFATTWCGYCAKTRELLANRGVDYFEYDIEASAEGHSKYRSLNGQGVPVLVVGNEIIHGYAPQAIDRALHALAADKHSAPQ